LFGLDFYSRIGYSYTMTQRLTTEFTNDTARDLGIRFAWAGGAALTVRVVDAITGADVDVFTMAGPDPVSMVEVATACAEWLDAAVEGMEDE